ncbi:acyltransferase family protein [Bacteroides caecigallinarum]|nr:acyltransferase family protein [Bacteroides caecigallinarum]MCF2593600.1 acyltransferase family protein [Bacteroides caecigallinarum]
MYKTESFDCNTYSQKLKKRSRTLLIPYLFWNLVVVLLYYLTQTFLSGLTSGENLLIKEYTWINWLKVFWDGNKIGGDMPINYPLWFVRDLMVVIVISPIVYFCVKHLKIIFVITLGLLWILGIWFTLPGFSITALFFFSYGAYYTINKKNFIRIHNSFPLYSFVLYIIIAICDLLTRQYDWHKYVHSIGILVGLSAIVSFVAYGIAKQKLHPNHFLSNSSFFIYVYHGMPLAFLIKFSVKVLQPQTDAGLIMLYLVCPLITILLGLCIYSVLIKYLPKFTAIITGGR